MQFPSGHSTVFAVVDNAAALAWVANLGCIELHTWHSRVPEIERPDYLLIDLDPTDRRPVAVRARDRARRARGDGRARARSYPKTSGATGLHILAPIKPELLFPEVRRFAKALAEEVERRIGDQAVATTTWRVADRVGVFVDFGQNARDRTIASRVLGAADAGRARLGAAPLGRGRRPSSPAAFTLETMRDADRRGRRPDARACGGSRPSLAAALREARARAARADRRLRRRAPRRRRVRVARRAQLAPRAVARVLVVAPADAASCRGGSGCPAPCRSAPRRRAPAARAPPRARRCPSGSAPRSAARAPLRAAAARVAAISSRAARADRARADVVELAVVAVEAEQQRRDRARGRPSSGRRRRRSRPSCAPSP